MNHGRSKGVAGPNRVGSFDAEAGMLVLRRRRHQQASVCSAGDAHQLNSEFPAQPAAGKNVALFRIFQGTLHQVEEAWKLLVVELEHLGKSSGIAQHFAAEIGLAEVDVENSYREGRHGAEIRLDG